MLWSPFPFVSSLASFSVASGSSASVNDYAAQQSPLAAAHPHTRVPYDIQGHRGGRGDTVENTLPSFAWGLINGVRTLELDNGITKDGVVVVWHDEDIQKEKCSDTKPAFPGDPDFPYVGKFIVNLTLAQIKTLDCGSSRLHSYPLQLTYPGTKISTLKEFFDFVSCADPDHKIHMNIESKINADRPNQTATVEDFVTRQHRLFVQSPYVRAITYQSFDWRTLVGMKKRDPRIKLSGLLDDTTLVPNSTWFAGADVNKFPGPTLHMRAAQMAASFGLQILSPAATAELSPTEDPAEPDYVPFTTEDMVREAHRLGIEVKPWTVNQLGVSERIIAMGVDGIITDYPDVTRRWAGARGIPVAPQYPPARVLSCLAKHNQVAVPPRSVADL